MNNYKYIVFDFDGTIADSSALFVSIYNEIALKNGYQQLTQDNLQQLRAMSIPERCKMLGVPLYKIPFLFSAIIKKFNEAVPMLNFHEGMKELLLALADNKVKFAVLSSNSKANIDQFFKQNNVKCKQVYSSRSIFGKHVLINKFLKEKNLNPSQILYVGDELRDVIACRKSGVKMAWVSWGYDTAQTIANNKPDYLIDNPAQILALALGQLIIV
jgi:phosphoglycolate phosphatase